MVKSSTQSNTALLSEIAELQSRLAEYQQLIDAVRSGAVDAMVLQEGDKQRLIGFEDGENEYRELVEKMPEGALILSAQGIILYGNHYMADMLHVPLAKFIGSSIDDWLPTSQIEAVHSVMQLLSANAGQTLRDEYQLRSHDGRHIAVYLAMSQGALVDDQYALNIIVTDLTERKRNEAIAADERLARAILEQASDAVVVCDPAGKVIRASGSARRLCGGAPVGGAFEQSFPLLDQHGRQLSLDDILAFDRLEGQELSFAGTPQPLYVHVSASRLWAPERDNEVLGSVLSLTDITHIKQAELSASIAQQQLEDQLTFATRARRSLLSVVEDVRASDSRLKKISSRLPGMIYQYVLFVDGRHAMPYVSEAVRDIFGLEPEEVRQDAAKLFDKIDPDDLKHVVESIQQSARELTPWKCEFRVLNDDGRPHWLYGDAIPQQQEDGSVLWHGFVSDVTERKSTEAEVRLAANVFRQSCEGIMITDADNKIVMVNKAFTKITGYSEDEALGQNPKLLNSGRQDRRFYRDMWETIESMGYWEGEIWNRRKDGSIYPEWLSITRTYDDKGGVLGHIGIFEDITQRKEYEKHIQWLAHYDSLTALPNRTLLCDRVEHAISIAQRSNKTLAILFCDLDRFKNVNDALGHSIGDELLIEVAKRLTSASRKEDTVSRQGGDEFIILLPDSGPEGAAFVAEKIQQAVNLPYTLNGSQLIISLSIGIAVFPDDGEDFDALAKNADIAMYRAKHLGRNNYCYYTSELQRMTTRVLKLEKDIRNSIDNHELELFYQPQVSLADGKITGVEALLRWNHAELGMISPAEFIPIAENSGQILRIGEWVTRTAVQQVKQWLDDGLPPVKMAVNLSVRELRQPRLFAKLKSIIDEVGLNPEYLELEVTESMMMEDTENVVKTLHRISELGIKLSIDDFGTGYSSLSYLKRLPVDQLKIDMAFVQDMLTNAGDAIIVRSIISLGHSLGLNVIAEGVEDTAQLDFLRAHYCDHMQGYLFSKPLPGAEMSKLLASGAPMALLADRRDFSENSTILIVDDEPNVINALKRALRQDDYRILTAESGKQGLDVLATHEVSVILTDQRMPGMSGVELLNKAKKLYPDSIRMVLSGYTDLKTITDAINRGDIYKFLTKPWDDELLRANVREAFQRYSVTLKNRMLMRELKEANKALAQLSQDAKH